MYIHNSIYKSASRHIYRSLNHIHGNHLRFCTTYGSRPRLKSKVPGGASTADAVQVENVSRFAQFAEEARKFEENYRWISPRNSVIAILIYLAISFGCFWYMWYHRLYASRMMYVWPFLQNLNPERAHLIAVKVHQWPKFIRRIFGMINNPAKDPTTKQKIMGLTFLNPIGLAPGFDKHGECIDGTLDLGFGFVEVGTVTPNEQKGNKKPRVWRLKKDLAAIQNYGNNSVGHECVRARLLLRIENMDSSFGLVGVNLGKNAETKEEDAVNDYILGIKNFVDIADYLVFNIDLSSKAKRREELRDLLKKLMQARDEFHEKAWETTLHSDVTQTKPPAPPLLIKVAPDVIDDDLEDIAFAAKESKIDGIILSSSTRKRDNLDCELKSKEKYRENEGEICGKPIFHRGNEVMKKMYGLTKGEIPLIGVGGISSARDAYARIKSGASLVQLYTAYTYNGPFLIRRMLREIGQYAELDGFGKIEEAVGYDVRMKLGMKPLSKELSFEEEELMAPLIPIPQKSLAARAYGVLDKDFKF